MANPNLSNAGTASTSKEIAIHFGPRAKPRFLSGYSRAVLKAIMTEADVHTLWITSTYRDAGEQASAMAHNIERKGSKSQKNLYRGKPGSGLIDLYEREKTAIARANDLGIETGIRSDFALQRHLVGVLERSISRIGPEKVSNHSGLQAILNVFDVDPGSMIPNNVTRFIKAARDDTRVTRIIEPPNDPAIHFEIAQLGDFLLNPRTSVTA